MPGSLIKVIPRTKYDFTDNATGYFSEIILAKGIDVSQYRELTAVIRIHALNFLHASSAVYFFTRPEAPTAEDPATDFIGTSAFPSITNAIVAPYLMFIEVPAPFGSLVNLSISGTQGAVSYAMTFTMSVDFLGKS